MSERLTRSGRNRPDPSTSTETIGKSEIFSAKLMPGLFWNSDRDFDAVDWYCSSTARGNGDAVTTTSLSGIADGSRSKLVPTLVLIASVTRLVPEANPLAPA